MNKENINKTNKIQRHDLILFRLLFLNLKNIYSTLFSKLIIFLSPVLVAIALGVMMPIYYSVAAGQIFVVSTSAGTIFGITYYCLRNSTVYKNMLMTRITLFKMYISILICMLLITFFSEIIYWLTTIMMNELFDKLGITTIIAKLIEIKNDTTLDMNWLMVDWITIIYSWFLGILLVFLSSFLLKFFVKNSKTYFMILFSYIIFLAVFGGMFEPNFVNTENGINYYGNFNIFQKFYFLIPKTHLNRMCFAAILAGTICEPFEKLNTLHNFNHLASFKWSNDWRWNISIWYPLLILFNLSFASIFMIEIYE
ncbi:MAG: hypothetical protein TYPL_1420 [Candidatus Tyloplasma litorale]|nr:MAG: hypothetical protein TYPL_1420 [Mycoplasmatales bacterium]